MTESTNVKTITFDEAVQNGIKGKSGTIYRFNSELSADRYFKASEWLHELSFGLPMSAHLDLLDQVIGQLNKGEMFNASITIQKMRENLTQIALRQDPARRLFCLYFDAEGEDSAEFNEQKILTKAEDLSQYSYYSFFALALKLLSSGEKRFKEIAELVNKGILQQNLTTELSKEREKLEEAMQNSKKSLEKENQVK